MKHGVERQQEVIGSVSNGDISNDLHGPGFQGHGKFEVEYLKKRESYGHSNYGTLILNHA